MRTVLLAGAALGALVSAPAFAQDAAKPAAVSVAAGSICT